MLHIKDSYIVHNRKSTRHYTPVVSAFTLFHIYIWKRDLFFCKVQASTEPVCDTGITRILFKKSNANRTTLWRWNCHHSTWYFLVLYVYFDLGSVQFICISIIISIIYTNLFLWFLVRWLLLYWISYTWFDSIGRHLQAFCCVCDLLYITAARQGNDHKSKIQQIKAITQQLPPQ